MLKSIPLSHIHVYTHAHTEVQQTVSLSPSMAAAAAVLLKYVISIGALKICTPSQGCGKSSIVAKSPQAVRGDGPENVCSIKGGHLCVPVEQLGVGSKWNQAQLLILVLEREEFQ